MHKEIQAVRNTTDILKKEILESVTQANQKNNEYLLEKIANLIGKQSDNKLTKASTTSAIIEHHD